MREISTLKNVGIRRRVPKFWQRTANVCCWFLLGMFLVMSAYATKAGTSLNGINNINSVINNSLYGPSASSPCLLNTVTVSDAAVCTGEEVSIGQDIGGNYSAMTYQWQMWNGSTFVNLSDGGVYSNTQSRDLQISDAAGLNGAEYRVVDTFDPTLYCYPTVISANGSITGHLYMTLTVYDSPIVTVTGNPAYICQGQTSVLTANISNTGDAVGPYTYQWYNGSITIDGATNSTLTVSDNSSYCVLVYDAYFCPAISCGSVVVNTPPVVTCPAPQIVCAGSNVTFTASSTGSNTDQCPISYSWTDASGAVLSTSLSLNLTDVQSSSAYTFTAANCCGSSNCTVDITVNYLPTINTFVTPDECIPTSNIKPRTFTFTVSATGTTPLSYQWYKNGIAQSGATNTSFTIITNSASDATTYEVIVSNICGSQSASGSLFNCPCTAPRIIQQPVNDTICAGLTGTFSVVATGTQPLIYQWYMGSNIIPGATNNSLLESLAGQYEVVITNDSVNCGQTLTSDTATLILNTPPVVSCPLPQIVCAGSNVIFTGSATGTNTTQCPTLYSWTDPDDGNTVLSTSNQFELDNVQESDTLVFTATNCCGSSTCNAYLTVNPLPVITTPPGSLDVTLECNDAEGLAAALALVPIANGACTDAEGVITFPVINLISDITTPSSICPNAYVRVRTWNFTNCCGTTVNFVQTITVQDLTAPLVPDNGGSTVQCVSDVVTPTPPSVFDVCGAPIIPALTSIIDSPSPLTCQGIITYTFTYTDCAGLTAQWEYVYTILHNTAPVVPDNEGSTVQCVSDVVTPTPPAVFDVCGAPITPALTSTIDSPSPLTCQGTITYTFTYTDCAGLTAQWEYVYTILHNTAPVVPDNGGSTVQCVSDVVTPTPPAVFDVCGAPITPALTSIIDSPSPLTCQGIITYTFTYTDCAGLSAQWEYVYTILHSTAPVVPDNGGSLVQCVSDVVTPTPPSVFDVCGAPITPVLTSTIDNPSPLTCQGTITYTFTYTDCAGLTAQWEYVYTIQHNTAPVVPDNGGSTVQCVSDVVTPTPPAVFDVCGAPITPALTSIIDSPSPLTCQGIITYTFTFTDCAGLSAQWEYVYTILHNTAPVVPDNGGSTVQCVLDVVTPTPPSVFDVCGAPITPALTSTIDSPSPLTCQGTITYTFTYTDCAGLTAQWEYVYTILHNTAPVVPDNGGSTVQCVSDVVTPTPPSVFDVCGAPITPALTSTIDSPSPLTCQGIITYTFTYTDCAGLSAQWEYVYTILHSTAPVVPDNGGSLVQCVSDVVTPTPPSVFDVCGAPITPVLTSTIDNPSPLTCQGTITYTFTYTDCAGLTAQWEYVYTIQHNTAPVVPDNEGSTVQCVSDVVTPTPPSVFDVCGAPITPALTSIIDSPSPLTCQGIITYTFTFTDCAGLSAQWEYVYTILHNTAPVVPDNGGSLVQCVSDVVTPTPPAVFDVCGAPITPALTSTIDSPSPLTCQGTITYTFTYTDCAGLSAQWEYVYTILHSTAPVVPDNEGSTVQCVSDVVTPTPPAVFDVCGAPITPALTSTIDSPSPLTCQGTITYTFTYTDCAGLTAQWEYVYTILHNTAPVITTPDGSSTVATLSGAVPPTPPVVYDVCGNLITPISTYADNPNPIVCNGTRTYTFTYTDCAGLISIWTYTYTINGIPLSVTCMPPTTTSNIGDVYTFSVNVTAGLNVTYQWSFNGTPVSGQTNSSYTRTLLSTDNGEQACVTVSSSCGEPITCCTTLNLCTPPTVSCVNSGSTCLGGSFTFGVTATGTGPLSYQWYKTCWQKETSQCEIYEKWKKWNHCKEESENNQICNDCKDCNINQWLQLYGNEWKNCTQQECTTCEKTYSTTTAITGANSSSYTISDVQYSDTCSYFVIVTNACGNATSCNGTITINTPPVITCQPKGNTVCTGSAITSLVVTAKSSTTPVTYQWFFDGVSLGINATSSAYAIASAGSANAGNYYVIVSNPCSSVTSCTVTITINTPPVLTCQPSSVTVCANQNNYGGYCNICPNGSSACFTIYAKGTGLCYKWLENGKPVSDCYNGYSGSKTADFCVLNTCGKNGYLYSVIVSNTCGSVTSNAGTLYVANPPVITIQPQSVCVINGGSATFTITVTNAFDYQWQTCGNNIYGATGSSYTINNVTGMNGKYFTVVVTNSCGSVISCKATLSVIVPCSAPANLSDCANGTNGENLKWTCASSAKSYFVKYWTCSTDTNSICTSNPSASLCNLACGKTYYWSVRTECNCNCNSNKPTWSCWSKTLCFTTPSCKNKCNNRDITSSNNTGEEDVKVYPNPTKDLINVDMSNFVSAPNLIIYNMSGQVVYSENKINVENAEFIRQIDMSSFAEGVYFIKLTNDEMTKTVKFIKQR